MPKKETAKKRSFVLYDDFYEQLQDLTPEQAGHYLKAIYAYRHDEEYLCDDKLVKFALKGTIAHLKRDHAKYVEICKKRSDAGIKGAKQKLAKGGKRKQKVAKEADSDTDNDIDSVTEKKETANAVARRICDFYNANRGLMSECQSLHAQRISAINARIKQHGEEKVRSIILQAKSSDFLQGLTEQAFKCGIDWIMSPKNFAKIMEGNYVNRKKKDEPDFSGYAGM